MLEETIRAIKAAEEDGAANEREAGEQANTILKEAKTAADDMIGAAVAEGRKRVEARKEKAETERISRLKKVSESAGNEASELKKEALSKKKMAHDAIVEVLFR